ncbi:MAG: RagB/SusD family nutrient uptake outer membrane protein [Cyclobacteriaceae bacterium]|nr:RagB/SusD family nutrient uptake outer membrane protein [Cyclobacteriaceae bacterium]
MKRYIILFLVTIALDACESFVEIAPPKTESVSSIVYADDVSATAAIRGIYHEMVRSGFASGLSSSVTFVGGASADELISYGSALDEFYNNNVLPTSNSNSAIWAGAYKSIYYCNSAIEGLQQSTSITAAVRNQLLGEAKFIRSFCHFYLTNLYGEIPISTSTDYVVNSSSKRATKDQVIALIKQDLTEAQGLLANDFQFTSSERVRVTSWAASAMLARVHLYSGDWVNAESVSTTVINQATLFKLVTDLNVAFLKNSTEAIWQLMPVVTGQNTNEGSLFIPFSSTSLPSTASLTTSLINSFEVGDKRKTNWTGNQTVAATVIYFPLKYKVRLLNQPVTEYSMVLRLAEQYLIRSEARARQGKLPESMSDLDVIRSRAGLPSIQTKIPVPTMDNLLLAIEQERRVEFFSEWGHRWLDLKRWDRANAVLQPVKPGWALTDLLYPIPQTELAANPNLNPQNSGY